jgi:uncharacterized membrane protein YhaH (DUF805 family)
MAMMAMPLVMAATLASIDLWGVVPGLLSVPALILIDAAVNARKLTDEGRIQEG